MSFFKSVAEFVTVDPGTRVDVREIDQFMARADGVQAAESHQGADGGLVLSEAKKLGAETRKGVLGLSHVPRRMVMLADLSGTDRKFSRSRQRHVSEGEHPLERVVPKAQNCLDRSADQLKGYLTQKVDGRNRNQVDTTLHAASQSGRRFNLGFRSDPGLSRTRRGRALSSSGQAALASLKPEFVSVHSGIRSPIAAADQSTLMDRF